MLPEEELYEQITDDLKPACPVYLEDSNTDLQAVYSTDNYCSDDSLNEAHFDPIEDSNRPNSYICNSRPNSVFKNKPAILLSNSTQTKFLSNWKYIKRNGVQELW